MYTELVLGKETYKLNENGKNLYESIELNGLASQVPIFIHMIKSVESHFICLRYPDERQSYLIETMDILESGVMPFESEEDLENFMEEYNSRISDGVFNKDIIDLGGIGLKICGEKYTLEYFFDGICPSEKIFDKEGNLISEISRDRILISVMNGETICNFRSSDVKNENLGINIGNNLEEFIKVNLNEETLPSIGVIFNEFGENEKLKKAFDRIYRIAYIEKYNALKDIVSSVYEPDGSVTFLINIDKKIIDEGLIVHPEKLFIYSV